MYSLWRPLKVVAVSALLVVIVVNLALLWSIPKTQIQTDFWSKAWDFQSLFLPPSQQLEGGDSTRQHLEQQQKQQQQQQQQKQQQKQQQQPKCRKLRLWPSGLDETEDRILDQLKFRVPQPNISKVSQHNGTDIPRHMRIILLDYATRVKEGRREFTQCPVSTCYLTKAAEHGPIADAVLFGWHYPQGRIHAGYKRPLNQRWVVHDKEPPHISHFPFNFIINYTATYRRDSTIVTPYAYFVPFPNASKYQTFPPKQNFAAGKNKSVVWFVSNCRPANNRMGYAQELAKHIDVDIYGGCGNLSCKNQCWGLEDKVYKFYLAFENTNCKDYITEKFFVNALQHKIVPIVMGAHPDEYRKVAPLNSYIHVDDFESPKELAAYLHKLNNDDQLYNNYFRWKGSGKFMTNTKFWCRLCALINDDSRSTWYEDVNYWWKGPGICVHPSPENPFASWTLAQKQSSHNKSHNDPLFNPSFVEHPANASSSAVSPNGTCQ